MPTRQHELTLAGQPGTDDLAAALAPRHTLAPDGRPRPFRRVWLDTFDWRLRRAGLTLVDETRSGRREVVLFRGGGEVVATGAGPGRWPCLARELPEGPLRSALAPVAGIRALLPLARAGGAAQRLRARDPDQKTVAWLSVERAGDTGSDRLTVSAVRGCGRETAEIRDRLLAAGLAAPGQPPLDAALAAAGRRPLDYSGKVDVTLSADLPAGTAMTTLLLSLLDTLEANVPGTIRDLDTEFLHDLRVAVRRTRSALKLGGDVLAPELTARFRPEFKWLGDATTPTRDLDVYLLSFGSMTASLAAASPADLEPLREHLLRQRAAEQRRLARLLRSARFRDLSAAWRAELTAARPPADRPALGAFAAERISRAHRRVLADGAAITSATPPQALHDLRKRSKELRYALEFFASLHDPAAHREALGRLKGLQDCLGEFQDRQVQREELEMFATQMMRERDVPASALLAMGDLAAQLALRQRAARDEFAGRFADFSRRRARRQFKALTGKPAG